MDVGWRPGLGSTSRAQGHPMSSRASQLRFSVLVVAAGAYYVRSR